MWRNLPMNKSLFYRFIKEAEDKRVAIGHFNFSDVSAVKGIMGATADIARIFHFNIPICLGTSEGEAGYLGARLASAVVNSYKSIGKQAFLNGDHIHSLEKLKEIIEAGYDSVSFDATHLPFEQNIELTREAVLLSKSINPEFIIEGEINYISGSSNLLDDASADIALSTSAITLPEDAKRFVDATGVDLISPSIGNIHGILKNSPNPRIDIARIRAIKKITHAPIVLHGGSGLRDEDFIQAIYAGVSIIHINTEIRIAWRRGIESSLAMNPNEVTPYKLLTTPEKAIQGVVFERLKLFNKLV